MTGDGFAEWAVGAPLQQSKGVPLGAAFVFAGGPTISTTDSIRLEGAGVLAWFGHHVGAAGDRNGDSFQDLVVGAPQNSVPISRTGTAYSYFGTAMSIPAAAAWSMNNPFATAGDERFGTDSASGDFDGDGYGDLAVGAPQGTNPETDEGLVFILLGDSGGGDIAASATLDNPTDRAGARFGSAVD